MREARLVGAVNRLRTLTARTALSPRDPERMAWAAYLAATEGDRRGLDNIGIWWEGRGR